MKCKRCSKDITYLGRGRPPKYCSDCAYIVKLEQNLSYLKKRRFFIGKLGTSNFSSHFSGDFKKEMSDIKKEKERIGI